MQSSTTTTTLIPFSADVYNGLPEVDDAERLLEQRDDRASFFDQAGKLICDHGLQSTLGLCLLHKHHRLADDDLMVEAYDATSYSRPSLVMARSKQHEAPSDRVPVVLKVDPTDNGYMPLEHSTVDLAVDGYGRLEADGATFLSEFQDLARDRGFSNLIGLGILRNSKLACADGEGITEIIDDTSVAHVVQAQPLAEAGDAITTLWKFSSDSDKQSASDEQTCEKVWTCVIPKKGDPHQKGEKIHQKSKG